MLGRGHSAHRTFSLAASWRRWGSSVEAARAALARHVERLTRARYPPARPEWTAASARSDWRGDAGGQRGGRGGDAAGPGRSAYLGEDPRLRAADVARSLRAAALSAGAGAGAAAGSAAAGSVPWPAAGGACAASGRSAHTSHLSHAGTALSEDGDALSRYRDGLNGLLSAQIEAGGSYAYKLSDFRRLEPRDKPTLRAQMRAALTPTVTPVAPGPARGSAGSVAARGGGTQRASQGGVASASQSMAWGPSAQREELLRAGSESFGLLQPPAGWIAPRSR